MRKKKRKGDLRSLRITPGSLVHYTARVFRERSCKDNPRMLRGVVTFLAFPC